MKTEVGVNVTAGLTGVPIFSSKGQRLVLGSGLCRCGWMAAQYVGIGLIYILSCITYCHRVTFRVCGCCMYRWRGW